MFLFTYLITDISIVIHTTLSIYQSLLCTCDRRVRRVGDLCALVVRTLRCCLGVDDTLAVVFWFNTTLLDADLLWTDDSSLALLKQSHVPPPVHTVHSTVLSTQ